MNVIAQQAIAWFIEPSMNEWHFSMSPMHFMCKQDKYKW